MPIRQTGGYAKNNDIDFIIKSVTAAVMTQIPAITAEAVKLTLNSVLTDIDNVQTVNWNPEFRLLDIEDQPKELHTAADLEEADFWESLLKEWRKFRTFIKYKSEADQAFLALCHDKYPDLSINIRTLYRKWKSYQQDGKQSLIDMRGRHGNHRRKENCHPDASGKFNSATYVSLVKLCADICARYKLNPLTDVIRHYDV